MFMSKECAHIVHHRFRPENQIDSEPFNVKH